MNMMRKHQKRGFTIVEILVVVSIIAILAGILMVAVQGARGSANTAKVRIKLKQISEWMTIWSGDNDDRVLPSQFDFIDEVAAGTAVFARNNPGLNDYPVDDDDNPYDDIDRGQYQGTWADILWTDHGLAEVYGTMRLMDFDQSDLDAEYGGGVYPTGLWETDSPDIYPTELPIFTVYEDFDHPFRSTFENTFGPAKGLPGFFAANDFFDARSLVDRDPFGEEDSEVDWYYTNSMIHAPARSVYLVDSVAGETIATTPEVWESNVVMSGDLQVISQTDGVGEVDFRYNGKTMMLMLDGSTNVEEQWVELGSDTNSTNQTLYGRGYRVDDLTNR
jgi:prepilin-type N-terminal cleavage/methylation domain-containing protein